MKKINLIFLALILLVGTWLRLDKLAEVPSSLSWDEVSTGYDGWAVANYGIDQWGHFLPISFDSFGDDKHPVHTYFTAISTKILGLNDYATRLPAALAGIANILLLYLLTLQLFKKKLIALLSAASMAISPYAIQFSRWDHEASYVILLFLLGSWLFFKGLEKKSWLLSLGLLVWGINLLSYHSAKVVVPPVFFLTALTFRKELFETKKYFLAGLVLLALMVLIIVTHPALLGTARINQTSMGEEDIKKLSSWYPQTQNIYIARAEVIGQEYLKHFSTQYLFISGDKNPRHSSQGIGQFYWLDLSFLIIGLVALLRQRSRTAWFVLAWAVLAPLPASLVQEAPHAARALYMMGSWHIIIGFGIYTVINLLRQRNLQVGLLVLIAIGYGIFLNRFWQHYLNDYNKGTAIEWQYGMKDVVEYVNSHPNYSQINVTAERHQPYIFFLYYMKTSPKEFLKTVDYENGPSKSYNQVRSYGKFHFGDWNTVESFPGLGILYVLTPSEYSGLRHKNDFMVKKKITYPNGSDAFYIVSYN